MKAPNTACINAARDVLIAQAKVATVKPAILALHAQAMAKFMPLHEEHPELVISDFNKLYLASDSDSKAIYNWVDDAIAQDGYKVKRGYCPLLVAEDDLRKAERVLIAEISSHLSNGITVDSLIYHSMGAYHKYVELSLKAIMAYCNETGIDIKAGV